MAVICNPLATMLNREGCKPCVLNQISSGLYTPAQIREDGPMAGAGMNQLTMRLVHEDTTESKRLIKSARFGENRAVGANTHHRTQNLRRDCVRRIAINHGFEPPAIEPMILGVVAKRINKQIDVRQNHMRPSIMSRSAAELSRSMPGATPPPSRETGSLTRWRRGRSWDPANTCRRPCSMREVSVSPLSCASRFACRSKCSSSRTVVRIGPNILKVCQYVNTENTERPRGAQTGLGGLTPDALLPQAHARVRVAP